MAKQGLASEEEGRRRGRDTEGEREREERGERKKRGVRRRKQWGGRGR